MNDETPRRPTDRLRGGSLFVEQRTNAWAALVGFYVGRGRLTPQIAAILRDGTTAETIRRLIDSWGIPRGRNRHSPVPVPLSAARRRKLQAEARRRLCSPEELARQLLATALDRKMIDEILAPQDAPVTEQVILPSDWSRFSEAMERLPRKEQDRAWRRLDEAKLYLRSDGKVRLELPERQRQRA